MATPIVTRQYPCVNSLRLLFYTFFHPCVLGGIFASVRMPPQAAPPPTAKLRCIGDAWHGRATPARLSVDFKSGLIGTQQSVFLTAAGVLETCNVRVDLKEALEHGEVLLGVDYRSLNGISAEYRPHEIAVSERKKAWCKPMGGIVFTPSTEDPDIVHSAIAWMATPGN